MLTLSPLMCLFCISLVDFSETAYLDSTSSDYCTESGCPISTCPYIQVGHNTRLQGYYFCEVSTAYNREECFNLLKTDPHIWSVTYRAECIISECETTELRHSPGKRLLRMRSCDTNCLNYTITKYVNCSAEPGPGAVKTGTYNIGNHFQCTKNCVLPTESCLSIVDTENNTCEIYTNVDLTISVSCSSNASRYISNTVECVPDYCYPPPEISHGNVTFTSTSYLSTATYECDLGYNMTGTPIVTCGADIEWNIVPSCELVDCGAPLNVSKAVVDFTNTTFSSMVDYSCEVGYVMNGSASVQCLASGQWESFPSCDIVDCSVPPSVPNATAVYNLTTYGSISTYQCAPDHLLFGSPSISCQDDGNWTISTFTCNFISPGNRTRPKNLYIMPCACSTGSFKNLTIDEIIAQLQAETEVDPKETTLSVYALKCRQDDRQSSLVTGIVGVIVISSIFGLIVLLDVLTVFKCAMKQNKTPSSHRSEAASTDDVNDSDHINDKENSFDDDDYGFMKIRL